MHSPNFPRVKQTQLGRWSQHKRELDRDTTVCWTFACRENAQDASRLLFSPQSLLSQIADWLTTGDESASKLRIPDLLKAHNFWEAPYDSIVMNKAQNDFSFSCFEYLLGCWETKASSSEFSCIGNLRPYFCVAVVLDRARQWCQFQHFLVAGERTEKPMERGSHRPHISATSVQAGLLELLALTAQLSEISSISAHSWKSCRRVRLKSSTCRDFGAAKRTFPSSFKSSPKACDKIVSETDLAILKGSCWLWGVYTKI